MRLASVLIAALSILLLAAPASAALIAVDRLAPADGEITRDTATGLDWLDLTLTTNVSLDDVQADVGGWVSDGWRHATRAEACGLFANAGNPGFASSCPFQELASVFVSEAASLVGLLGGTGFEGSISHGYLAKPDPSKASTDFARVGVPRAGAATIWEVGATGSPSADASIGNFLVRVVPEPPAGLLLAAGVALFGILRRR